MGLDANYPGFEKDGHEIEKLRVNGQLALHFLCLDNGYDQLFQNGRA